MQSIDDRIEGFPVGVLGFGAHRFFGPPTAGPSSNNRLELDIWGAHFTSFLADFILWGALAEVPMAAGDNNVLRANIRYASGSGLDDPGYFYANEMGPDGVPPADQQGQGNRLEIIGMPNWFKAQNENIPPPAAGYFIGQRE
jgi:hypothetical protein